MLHKEKRTEIFGKIGLGLSVACMIHCIASPIFIALLPIVGSELVHDPTLEIIIIGSSFLLVGITNLIGFLKHHKQYAPLVYMLLGFSLLVTSHTIHTPIISSIIGLFAGSLIALSLWKNQKAKQAKQIECSC